MGSDDVGRRNWTRQRGGPQEGGLFLVGRRLENPRNESRAFGGIRVWTTLVLVSSVADSYAEWQRYCDPPERVDAVIRRDRCAQHIFRNRCGMASLRNYATWISSGRLERQEAFRNSVLCGRDGRLCAGRSDREIRLANLRRRIAVSVYSPAGHNGLCSIRRAHTRQERHKFRIELWHPFLKSSGDWARLPSWQKPFWRPSWRMGCFSRLFCFGEPT